MLLCLEQHLSVQNRLLNANGLPCIYCFWHISQVQNCIFEYAGVFAFTDILVFNFDSLDLGPLLALLNLAEHVCEQNLLVLDDIKGIIV